MFGFRLEVGERLAASSAFELRVGAGCSCGPPYAGFAIMGGYMGLSGEDIVQIAVVAFFAVVGFRGSASGAAEAGSF